MAKKEKVKFNVGDLFFKEKYNPLPHDLVQAVTTSPLFGSVACVYNYSGGKAFIGHVETFQTGQVHAIEMVSSLGMKICKFSITGEVKGGGTLNLYTPWGAFNVGATRHQIGTSNPRYLQSKLKPESSHDAATSLIRSIGNAQNGLSTKLRDIVDDLIDRNYGHGISSQPQFPMNKLTENLQTFLAKLAANEVTMLEMPSSMRQEFDTHYSNYTTKRNKFRESIDKSKDFFDGEKWMYCPNFNGGVLLGAISPEPMIEAMDKFIADDELPFGNRFNYVKETVPFKWYKSLSRVPEEYQRQLEYSLMMLKTHRASAQIIPEVTISTFWQEMGAYSSSTDEVDINQCLLLPR